MNDQQLAALSTLCDLGVACRLPKEVQAIVEKDGPIVMRALRDEVTSLLTPEEMEVYEDCLGVARDLFARHGEIARLAVYAAEIDWDEENEKHERSAS